MHPRTPGAEKRIGDGDECEARTTNGEAHEGRSRRRLPLLRCRVVRSLTDSCEARLLLLRYRVVVDDDRRRSPVLRTRRKRSRAVNDERGRGRRRAKQKAPRRQRDAPDEQGCRRPICTGMKGAPASEVANLPCRRGSPGVGRRRTRRKE